MGDYQYQTTWTHHYDGPITNTIQKKSGHIYYTLFCTCRALLPLSLLTTAHCAKNYAESHLISWPRPAYGNCSSYNFMMQDRILSTAGDTLMHVTCTSRSGRKTISSVLEILLCMLGVHQSSGRKKISSMLQGMLPSRTFHVSFHVLWAYVRETMRN